MVYLTCLFCCLCCLFLRFPMPHLQCFGDQEVETSYQVRKKPLSAFGLTLYWSVIKVFYRTHRVFDKINLLGFNNKSVLSLPNSKHTWVQCEAEFGPIWVTGNKLYCHLLLLSSDRGVVTGSGLPCLNTSFLIESSFLGGSLVLQARLPQTSTISGWISDVGFLSFLYNFGIEWFFRFFWFCLVLRILCTQ